MSTLTLDKIRMFKELSKIEVDNLSKKFRLKELEDNTSLFEEGDIGNYFFIILSGEIEIVKAMGSEEERLIGVRKPGEFIGEMSLVNRDGLRMASARAKGETVLSEMTLEDFDILIHRHPKITYEIINVLADRLFVAHNTTIVELKQKNKEITIAYEELKAAQLQIIEKEKLERELEMAYEIQMSILPQVVPDVSGYSFGSCLVPARAVGGDFFDFIPLDEDRIGIFIGDVADKGVPSALFMAQIHALLYAEGSRGNDPMEVMKRVNKFLFGMNEKKLFATVIYGILDQSNGEFTYVRAGHDLPLLGEINGKVEHLAFEKGQLIGIFKDPVFDEQTITIPSGGTLLLYTDGATDGRNENGEIFGIENLISYVSKKIDSDGQKLCDSILSALMKFQGDFPQEDDITLLAIRRQ